MCNSLLTVSVNRDSRSVSETTNAIEMTLMRELANWNVSAPDTKPTRRRKELGSKQITRQKQEYIDIVNRRRELAALNEHYERFMSLMEKEAAECLLQ